MALKPRVLAIGGTDPTGGAGLARDVETIATLGASPAIAVTAITVQTDARFIRAQMMEPGLVAAQISAALSGEGVGAVKIGMLGSAGIVAAVAQSLAGPDRPPLVLDPVLVSTSGGRLLDPQAQDRLTGLLMPKTLLVTPNLPELAALCGAPAAAADEEELDRQARLLLSRSGGGPFLLVKGGHGGGAQATDILFDPSGRKMRRYASPRLPASLRGTGCMLASAIAVGLAGGQALPDAVEAAKAHVHAMLRAAAMAPVDHHPSSCRP